jgi:nifR3 family TIM-barrel protein
MTFEFRPFRIGPLEIGFPVVLAPLAGYSDLPYRLLCRAHGAGYCTTEMMLDRMITVAGTAQRRMTTIDDDDHPVAGQIVGCEPEVMAESARNLCGMGFDVIDLNFACPVRKALGRRRGGYMMSQPALTVEVIRAVTAEVTDRPVTVKLRQKFREADHDDAFWQIAEAAFEAGVAAITVHARSVEHKYTGKADWGFLAEVKRRFADRTIIGSGDVLRPADAIAMLRQTGVDATAVARGGLGNPWFFRQAADIAAGREPYRPALAEQRETMLRHLEGSCKLYGPLRGVKHMRKFGIKYARLHPHPKEVRMAFVDVKTPAEWHAVLDRFYGQ